MHEFAQELYELWQNGMAEQGVSVDDWQDLEHSDQVAWSKLAERLQARGWVGA